MKSSSVCFLFASFRLIITHTKHLSNKLVSAAVLDSKYDFWCCALDQCNQRAFFSISLSLLNVAARQLQQGPKLWTLCTHPDRPGGTLLSWTGLWRWNGSGSGWRLLRAATHLRWRKDNKYLPPLWCQLQVTFFLSGPRFASLKMALFLQAGGRNVYTSFL